MRIFISIILVFCLSLTILSGCTTPATENTNPGSSSPTGSLDPTGGNTEATGTSEPTAGTEATGSTESTEGNDNADATSPTDSVPSPDSKLTGEPITAEQYNALIANAPTNYSYTRTRTYNGTTTVITMLISGMEYMQTQTQDNDTRKLLNIRRNDQYKTYMFYETTGKWETSNTSVSSSFPLSGFPFPLSAFTYDESIGAYRMVVTDSGMTAEILLMFKNGQLIGLGQYSEGNSDFTTFYDYGTTVIPYPSDADIVDKSNTSSSNHN